MGPIIGLLQVARDHPAEAIAFTILFGWLWHSVVRLDHGRVAQGQRTANEPV
jgi:hypothetical protein